MTVEGTLTGSSIDGDRQAHERRDVTRCKYAPCQPRVIDLHTHILPALDDGVQTLEEGLILIRRLAADGVRTITRGWHGAYLHLVTSRRS